MHRTLALLTLLIPASALAQAPTHPLDGLSASEHWTLYETLRDSGEIEDGARFLYAGLNEPPKTEVLAWSPGETFRREARVHLVQDGAGYEAVVDLRGGRVLEFRRVSDRQYMTWNGEEGPATEALLEHPDFVAGLERRGVTDTDMLVCFPISDGYFDLPEERGRRIARITCWNRIGSISGLGSPISNLVGVVDLEAGEVLRVIDTGPTPDAPSIGEHHADVVGPTRDPLPPLVVSQPMGTGYDLKGHEVEWEGWRFHFRVDQRRGLVLSRVRHASEDGDRSVLYQGSLSELFVPYQDPAEPWNYQAYYDLGSYPSSFGGVASTLEVGQDCPQRADYFDAYVLQPDGAPGQRARVACLFERPGAEPAWRHTRGAVIESRARRDLVLRMVMGAGNYDYLFDWVFKQDGSIRVNLAATGIDQMKGVANESAGVATGVGTNGDMNGDANGGANRGVNGDDDRYGRFVAPHLVAVNHSHFFNFRLDFDVDGEANSLIVDRLVTERLPDDNPRRSVWRVDPLVAQREADGQRTSTLSAPELWRVVNPARIGPQGYPSGYLLEGHGAKTLLSPDDYMQRRAGFTNHTLWVTPHSPSEMYAAGDYPTSGAEGGGLPAWTSDNRTVENTDIVLWYTIGFHHVARPEDWPILPLELHGFYLKPAAFFDRNPAIDLPR
jgi:primary-amine oxidase